MSFLGASPEDLDGVARKMDQVSELISSVKGTIQAAVQGVSWMGPDAERFRDDWGSQQGTLGSAATTVGGLADVLRRRAETQRQASGGQSGSAPGVGPPSMGQPATSGLGALGGILGTQVSGSAGADGAAGGDGTTGPFGGALGGAFGGAPAGAASPSLGSAASGFFGQSLNQMLPQVLNGTATLDDLKPSAAGLLSTLGTHQVSGAGEFSLGESWGVHEAGSGSWGQYTLDAQAGIGFDANASGYAGLANGQLQAGFEAGARLGAWAEVGATADIGGFAAVGAQGEALAGAEVQGSGAATLSTDGLSGNLHGEAFAGAQAGGKGNLGLGDSGSGTLGGEVWAGAGVKADGDFSMSMDRIGGEYTVGIGLGVGAEVSFGLGFSPRGMVDDAGDVLGAAGSVASGAGSAFSSAADEIGGWIGW